MTMAVKYKPSDEEHHQHLGDDDPDEHTQRIDRGITDVAGLALYGIVGIAQGHLVCHRSAENTTDRTEVELL